MSATPQRQLLQEKGPTFCAGEPAHHAHVLIRGRVKIVQSGAGGEQLVVRFLCTGETFGTVGLYVDGLYPAEAIAADQVVEARWRACSFQSLVQKHPEIALNLLRVAAVRLQQLQRRLRELSPERAEHRVASTLLQMALRERQVNPDERVLPLSRRDIAELAGTTMYTASRLLSGWET